MPGLGIADSVSYNVSVSMGKQRPFPAGTWAPVQSSLPRHEDSAEPVANSGCSEGK